MTLYDDPRAAWTSYQPTGRVYVAPSSRVGIRWHWSGNPTRLAGKAHSACLSLVAAWERYHRDTRGWNSIGYNALVCPHGRAIEGRGIDYRGAHSGSQEDNAATYGVQLMVGEGELATPVMFARAAQLERALWDHSGRRLTSSGHRDAPGASTECPGPQIYAWAHSTHTTTGEDDMGYLEWPAADREQLAKDVAREVHRRTVQAGAKVEKLGDAVGYTLSIVRRLEGGPDPLTRAELLEALEQIQNGGATAEQVVDELAARLAPPVVAP